ncbi:MAG TPA: DUF1194 domain-containing protein [Stellaceae bacterium]|nr:DUF1194 domain-containing protein [Stellaceae bacterium]
MGSVHVRLLAIVIAFLVLGAGAARAEAVDVALVLATDVSRSIDDGEFQLQRKGYAEAISSAKVLMAIQAGVHRAVAVCFVEWAGPDQQKVVVNWMVIKGGESAGEFASKLLTEPRSFSGRTSISAAIDFAVKQFAASGVEADRRVIDISGDGTNNSGRPVTAARDEAVAAGFTINGLAIINQRPAGYFFAHTQPPGGLPNYYEHNVVGGNGAFMQQVKDFSTFGDSIINKLLTEISALGPAVGAPQLR